MSKEIHCAWVSRKADNEIYLGIDALDKVKKKVFYATSPIFMERQLFDTDHEQNSLCTISDKLAIDLMDYLWRIGIRPTGPGKEGL